MSISIACKKTTRIIIAILLFGCMLFSMAQLGIQIGYGSNDVPTVFYDSKPIYAAHCWYANKSNFYVGIPKSSMVQIFSTDGEFKKGILLPSKGGSVLMGTNINEELYIYCFRSDCEIVIKGDGYSFKNNVFYKNPKEFYTNNQITSVNLCDLNNTTAIFFENGTKQSVKLNVEKNFFSVDFCIILLVICIIGMLIVTGAFGYFLKETEKNLDKKENPYARIKRMRK